MPAVEPLVASRGVVEGLCRDVALGRRVVYAASSRRDARLVFEQVSAEFVGEVRRAAGCERVIDRRSGGEVRFVSAFGCRGLTADVVYVSAGLDVADFWPVVAAAGGEVIRA